MPTFDWIRSIFPASDLLRFLGFAIFANIAMTSLPSEILGRREAESRSACDSFFQCPSTQINIDYMLWWTNGTYIPPLVSTNGLGVSQGQAGVLPNSSTLYGGLDIGDSLRSGGKVQLLHWIDKKCEYALDLSYFGAGSSRDDDFGANSNTDPILARPFFNVAIGLEDAELVSFPGTLTGSIDIDLSSEFHSASFLILKNINRHCARSIDLTAGYRFFKFREGISITEQLISTNPIGLVAQGTTFDVVDSFSVSSEFHGAELGLVRSTKINWLTLRFTGKIAAGVVSKRSNISGQTVVSVPQGGSTNSQAGLYALPSNIGVYRENDFSLLPELGLRSSLKITENANISLGYTAFCVTNVLRVGSTIDRSIDVSQIPPGVNPVAARPSSNAIESELFAHSLAIGLEWNL